MDDPRETPRRIGQPYSWLGNEHVLPSWVVAVLLVKLARALLWLLRRVSFGRGPGRWAATVLERIRTHRAVHGDDFGFPPVYAWHHRQVVRFQALYLLFVSLTCGVGLVVGAPFYIHWHVQARREAERGGWPRLPVVGRWQPDPPVQGRWSPAWADVSWPWSGFAADRDVPGRGSPGEGAVTGARRGG